MAEAREEPLALSSAGPRPQSSAQHRAQGRRPCCPAPRPGTLRAAAPRPRPRPLLPPSSPSPRNQAPRPSRAPRLLHPLRQPPGPASHPLARLGSARPAPPSLPGRPPSRLSCVPSGGRMPSVSVSCYSNPLGERSRSGSAPSSSSSRPDPPRGPAPLRGACPPHPSLPPPPLPALRKCQGSRTGRRWFPFVLLAGSPVPGRRPPPPRAPPPPRRRTARGARAGRCRAAPRGEPVARRGAARWVPRNDRASAGLRPGRPGAVRGGETLRRPRDRPSPAAGPRAAASRA
ncbi:uncharacterized protein LOC133625561 [Colius striatus]|uniref:uncharacterized protein LOC133625561 n=1 Tax=Colius striatus TaxID=57412 RepID=UPI002B1E7021|nr:uncharacterized protein LOC133625561 [Colius striatus]